VCHSPCAAQGWEGTEGTTEKRDESEYNRDQKRQATNTNPMTNAEGKQRRWKETEEKEGRRQKKKTKETNTEEGEGDKHK
jgi:hypothetical protein